MDDTKERQRLKRDLFKFLGLFGEKVTTKFTNICSKTGQYDVPEEIFQKRTSRTNRVLISWKTVKNNRLTIENLKSFYGGCVVEFINEDFFENDDSEVYRKLKELLGSDEPVSSIITIRSESGSSSSENQRKYFEKLINKTTVYYRGNLIEITKDNYRQFILKRKNPNISGGKGNDFWEGFLYVSIKGGQQDTVVSYNSTCDYPLLFNPACEYANEFVCNDINFVVSFFALYTIDEDKLDSVRRDELRGLMKRLTEILKECEYDHLDFTGNLYEYCINHLSLKIMKGHLYDPIQLKPISINDFAIDNKEDPDCLDFTHNEAVNKNIFYWDSKHKCLLSPARPTNIFWSKHLSNMMQQNYTLNEYFHEEAERVARRNAFLNESL